MTAVYLHMQKRHWDYWVCASIAGLMIGGSALFLPANSAAAEVIVRVAPPATRVETVPPPPDRSYAWDPGHWQWNGRTYVWVPGHYIRYPHPHARWVPGHWVNRGGGWYWSPGTGDVSSKTFRDAVRSEIGPYRRPLQRYLALPKIIRDATPNEKFLSLNRWRKPGEVL